MFNIRTITCSLATAGVLFIGGQAIAQVAPLPPMTDPGLNPYVFTQICFSPGGPPCLAVSPAVPAGMRLVIQRISANGQFQPPTGQVLVLAQVFIQSGANSLLASATYHQTAFNGAAFAFDQPVLAYANAGSTVAVSLSVPNPVPLQATVTITGHLINCTPPTLLGEVNVCAPIQP
jgi:hypothetical protein